MTLRTPLPAREANDVFVRVKEACDSEMASRTALSRI